EAPHSHNRHRRGRRLRGRAHGGGRRGRHLRGHVAGERRGHAAERPPHQPSPGRAGVQRAGARAARDGGAGAGPRSAHRHRLHLREVLRHRLGDHPGAALPGAGRVLRFLAELHQRGNDRRRGRLGPHARRHSLLDHRGPLRAGACPPRRRQERRVAHRVPRGRGAWPRFRPRARGGPAGGARRQRGSHHEPLGRALVEARHQRHGQRAVRLHRPDHPRHPDGRHPAPLHRAARRRGHPHRPGARLPAGGNTPPRPRGDRPRGRGRRGGEARLRRPPAGRGGEARRRRAPALDGPGHGQRPPHRDRLPERLRRAAGGGLGLGRAGQRGAHPDRQAGRAGRVGARPAPCHGAAAEL
ncbi:MAG: hypothetical protein AVDCRST_MAG04-3463, partial [uncultured Acetobacteraceae bacterium]